MKFTINPHDLKDLVPPVATSAPQRPTMPVLGGIKISAADRVQFACFDYETSATSTTDADIAETGVTVVSARLLAAITKALPKKPATFHLDGPKLHIQCGHSKFTLPTMNADEHPDLPAPPDTYTVTPDGFSELVTKISVAASSDDTLPMLTGIKLDSVAGSMTVAATDRFRLAATEIVWDGPDVDVLVPAKPFVAALKHDYGPLSIGFGDGIVGIKSGPFSMTTRLLEADFPKWQQLFPDNHEIMVETDTDFSAAVRRVGMMAERGAQIRLDVADDGVSLSAGDPEGGSAVERVAATVAGDPILAAFNPTYLLDGLSVVGEPARIGLNDPNKPAVLRGSSGVDYLLMPVRLPEG